MTERLNITGYPYPTCPQIIVPFGGYERLREIVNRNLNLKTGYPVYQETKFNLTCPKCGEIAEFDSLEDLPNHSIVGGCGTEAIKMNEPDDGSEWRYVRFLNNKELFVHPPVSIVFEDYSDVLDSMKPRPFAKESMEVINWIQKHLKSRWAYHQTEYAPNVDLAGARAGDDVEPSRLHLLFYFENPNDAMLLKLVHY